jgi:hypothetical protein
MLHLGQVHADGSFDEGHHADGVLTDRLLSDYISYYHEDRTHLGLGKKTPSGRTPDFPRGRVIARPRLGGLHHRYDRAA